MKSLRINCPICKGLLVFDEPEEIPKSRIKALIQRKNSFHCPKCGSELDYEWRYEAHASTSPTGERRPCFYLKIPCAREQREEYEKKSPFAKRANGQIADPSDSTV